MKVSGGKLALTTAVAALALLTGADAFYTVGQAQQALVMRFGAPVQVVNASASGDGVGLHVKWPWVEQVVHLDRRVVTLQGDPQALSSPTGERLTVQAAMSYRIVDPLRFYRSEGDDRQAQGRLQRLLDTSVFHTFAGASMADIVSRRREALMQAALSDARGAASADRLGVQITDLRLLQAAPPPPDATAIAKRMQDAETAQAAQLRAEGDAHKRELIAQADREAADIRGDGDRQALEVRGDGDAQRAAILGVAYGADPDFARFFRRLEAYDQALNPANTTLILSPDNAFLDLFTHGPGAAPRPR